MKNNLEIVTIGTASRDWTMVGSEDGPLTWGDKKEAESVYEGLGGGAANAAITFARFGLKTGIVARLGKDESGKKIIQNLKSEGIKVFPAWDVKHATALSAIALNKAGERLVFSHRGASDNLTEKDVPTGALASDWWYVVPGRITAPIIFKLMNTALKKGIRLAINPSKSFIHRADFVRRLADISVLLVNREEAGMLVNLPPAADPIAMLRKIPSGVAVITDGPRGSWAKDNSGIYHAGVFPEKKIADRTGAGDSFGSAFVASIIRNKPITEALRVASANATSMVETIGAQTGILRSAQLRSPRFKDFVIKKVA
jgi:2-dehydro-3-deoxygluconokinase